MKKNHTNVNPSGQRLNITDNKRKSKNLHYCSTLVTQREIKGVFASGTKYTGKYVTLMAKKNESLDAPSKFLYTVTKNVRTKPAKNTIKRKVREVIRTMYSKILDGYHIAIIVHTPRVTFQMLKEDITDLLSLQLRCVHTT